MARTDAIRRSVKDFAALIATVVTVGIIVGALVIGRSNFAAVPGSSVEPDSPAPVANAWSHPYGVAHTRADARGHAQGHAEAHPKGHAETDALGRWTLSAARDHLGPVS